MFPYTVTSTFKIQLKFPHRDKHLNYIDFQVENINGYNFKLTSYYKDIDIKNVKR